MPARPALLLISALLVLGWSLPAQTPIRLAEDLALSPDGRTLAFSWRGDVWTAPIEGGAARRLTFHEGDDRQPAFSPDGKTLAFVSNRDGSSQIWLMPAGGGAARRLTRHSEGFRLHEWFPDGSALLVSGQRDHFWRDASRLMRQPLEAERAPTVLFDGYAEEASLSADGKSLIYVREGAPIYRKGYRGSQAAQLWSFDLASREHRLLRREDWACRFPAALGWVGDHLYVSDQDGCFNVWRHREGQLPENSQLTDFEDDGALFLAAARDGRTAVFRRLFDVVVLDLESGKTRVIELFDPSDDVPETTVRVNLSSADEVSFSPDGRMIAFTCGGDLWVMDAVLREPVRVTETAEEERSPLFVDDGTLLFVSDAQGRTDVWRATRADGERYFWQNERFVLDPLTADESVESGLRRVPGKEGLIAFQRDRGDLMLMKPDGSESRRLLASWNGPSYDFSPDGRWIVYAIADDDFNEDVWIAPLDGSRAPFNLSCHPDNDGDPVWSPDGKIIAFTGRRWGEEVDVAWVHLTKEGFEETDRDRKLEKALEAMQKGKKEAPKAKPTSQPAESRPTATGEKEEKNEKDESRVEIDFDRLRDRLRRISLPDSREGGLIFWAKGAKLLFRATIAGKAGLYAVDFPEAGSPKLFCADPPQSLNALPDCEQLAGLSGGKPALLDKSGKVTPHAFSLRQSYGLRAFSRAVFDQAWRLMRDGFYDERLGNRNWDEIRRKYGAMAGDCVEARSLSTVCNMMLGELNGSHLGFSMRDLPSAESPGRGNGWRTSTVHLGARFADDYKGPGWLVRDVIPGTPAAAERSLIRPGEIILMVDGRAVDPGLDVAAVLDLPPDHEIQLDLRGLDGVERKVSIRPTSYAALRAALYDHWVEGNRARVDELSEGKLGYLHIRGMGGGNLLQFDEELYRVGHGKAGLVIDVRENGGGSITDHLLTSLTQPSHAITRPRGGGEGYPHDRRIYATWDRPIVVLCNQNSFSNAEIFAHAIKTLGRGRVVGVRTAGGVISTGGARVMGGGFIRMPFRGWYLFDGEDMELNGCRPDLEIWPEPGDWPAGRDRQLEQAVTFLKEDVAAWEARPRPRLRKASER
ncbi:MAG: PD40 domain-containing protein [Planctomycetes bacterium]|nr:PD40 domain-containing protein [Planctomycetota bacterium]